MHCSPLGFEHMVENRKPKVGEVGISPTVPTSSRESRQPFVHLVFQMLQRDIDASVDKSACEFRSRRRGPELILQILSPQYSS